MQYIRAVNGVLIASGGFAQNVRMRTDHDPRLTATFTSTNHPGATGEVIQSAQMIGANTIQMDWIQLGPWTSPDEKGFGLAPLFVESTVGYGPMVDPATGKRFIKETGNRKVRADAIVALGHPVLIYACEKNVMNKVVGHNMTPEMFKKVQERGTIRKNQEVSICDYHDPSHSAKGKVVALYEFDGLTKKPNEVGPFYACRLWPRVHHCMGGLEINNEAQVIDARGKVIPNLYAAGEATGGVHGMVRLGTVAVADCTIFGRTAARTAVKLSKK